MCRAAHLFQTVGQVAHFIVTVERVGLTRLLPVRAAEAQESYPIPILPSQLSSLKKNSDNSDSLFRVDVVLMMVPTQTFSLSRSQKHSHHQVKHMTNNTKDSGAALSEDGEWPLSVCRPLIPHSANPLLFTLNLLIKNWCYVAIVFLKYTISVWSLSLPLIL